MFGALVYNQNKVDSEEAKVLFSNKMLLSEDGNFSIGECMRSFEMQMPVQLSTKKPILHISINPHPEDVLTDQQLSDIAKEYMQKLGYGNQPYLVYKHTDIGRHHIHIVGLRVDENGRPLNDKFEHRRSKQITRELEKKYNLHPAERKERAERPELKKVDYATGDVKHQIGNTVKAACYGYRFQSFGEYKALLAVYNVCAEDVKGEVNGKPYQGIVYSAMNDKGEKAGNPVKASRIGNCNSEYEEIDMTAQAKWVINCIAETKGRFGQGIVIGTLLGANRARLKEVGAVNYKSYGKLAGMKEAELRPLIAQLISDGYIIQTQDEYSVLKMGDITPLKQENAHIYLKRMKESEEVKNAKLVGKTRSTGSSYEAGDETFLSGSGKKGRKQTGKAGKRSSSSTGKNTAIENIFARKSVRTYTPQPIEKEKVDLLVKAAMAAPTAEQSDFLLFVL